MSNTFYFGYFIILNKRGVLNNNNMRNLFCSKPNCCIIYKFKKNVRLIRSRALKV